jgi:transcriptional regulator with XRE-family HTH domain
MSLKSWEKKVLDRPGARERVEEIEHKLLVAHGLAAARRKAKVSQTELARRLGVSQPRIAAIERSEDVTVGVLTRYVEALGGTLEISALIGKTRTPILGAAAAPASPSNEARGARPPDPSARRRRGALSRHP